MPNRDQAHITCAAALALLAVGAANAQAPRPQLANPAPEGVRVNEAGVFANYLPASGRGKHPGMIVLGGSEGGLGTGSLRDAKALQAHGFNVLQLAYFGAPEEPDDLADIPLETFDRGLAWLKARSEVDSRRIGVEGASKGAEAALLFAARRPEIKAVVVGMPSSVVWQGLRFTGPATSSWT
ncbi:MAG TPA: acyl-CoA thioester hydrolase/BAAT C-terminal domain-containing protein, partial [Phenylobacterium sp.]|nr:acyl-CoA thioester hydrolase/BAAT C-terminal domain-containing protein [Phenylobacterium sp.]